MTDAEIATAVGSGSGGQVFSSNTTELTYNTESLLNGISLPLSGGFNFGYTPTHQVATMGVGGTSGALDLERAYEYGVHGEILTLHNPAELRFRQFGYDAAGRLTEQQHWEVGQQWVCDDPWDIASCAWQPVNQQVGSTTFAWDSVGNPTDRNAVVQTGNRLTSYDGWTMAYDSAGYLVSRSKSGVPTQTFAWNGLGQLTSVTTSGVGTVSFEYDGFGRRVRRTSPASVVSQYLYDGADLLMELDGNGNRRRAYTHYSGIDQPHSVREFTGTHASPYYFAMELPGHVTGLLNASGARVNHYGYSAFGKLEHVSETIPNPLRYMAREWDADAGLYYVRNRWYDPEVGRFISEDPIGLAGGINVYAYAANDPINARDPYGLEKCVITYRYDWIKVDGKVVWEQVTITSISGECGGGGGSGGGTGADSEKPSEPSPWLIAMQALRGCPAAASQWAPNPLGRGPGIPRWAYISLERSGNIRSKSWGGLVRYDVAHYRGTFSYDLFPSAERPSTVNTRNIRGEVHCATGTGIFTQFP